MKVDYAIICDDLRQEITNKFIAIGIYGGTINVEKFPWAQRMAALIAVHEVRADETIKIMFSLSSGSTVAQGTVDVKAEKTPDSLALIAMPAIPLMLSGPDTIILTVEMANGDRVDAARISVQKGPVGKATTP